MFSQILKWVETVGEKEFSLLLDSDTSLEALEEFAMRLIKHSGIIKAQQAALKAQNAAVKPVPTTTPEPIAEVPAVPAESKVEELVQAPATSE